MSSTPQASGEAKVKPWDRCFAHVSHLDAPAEPATFVRESAEYPGWYVVIIDGSNDAMYAHRVTPRTPHNGGKTNG